MEHLVQWLVGKLRIRRINPIEEPADLFLAIRDGHFYGSKPVSRVELDLETIWFREWTTKFMPLELKQALGIPVETKSTG